MFIRRTSRRNDVSSAHAGQPGRSGANAAAAESARSVRTKDSAGSETGSTHRTFRPSVSVFFPCYNEEANVERTTLAALRACDRLFDEYEVIIVNDGSRDRTGEIADRLAAQYRQVRAVHNRPNRGYGGALRRGFAEARMAYVFYTDGDGQFDFEEMENLLPLLQRHDIASAYRRNRRDPLHRRINAACWGALVDLLFGLRLRDVDCAFKVYPRRLFEEIELESNGALIDTEVLAKAKGLGYTIGQIGVNHYPRTAGAQTGASPRVILRAFRELFALHSRIRGTSRQPAPAVGR